MSTPAVKEVAWMAKVLQIGDQVVITMNLVEAEALMGFFLEANYEGTLLEGVVGAANSLQVRTLSQPPAEEGFDPKGGIRCHVDPAGCTWTGKSLARSKVHASRSTLQQGGHLPKPKQG